MPKWISRIGRVSFAWFSPSLLALVALQLLAAGPALAASRSSSAQTPQGAIYERVVYGPRPEFDRADVFASPTPGSPLVILVHGGGWRLQTGLYFLRKEALQLQAHGFTVVEINYEQDNTTRPAFPIEPEAVVTATRWAVANAATYNANPANVVLVGGSAGGNLVALAAEQMDTSHPGSVRAVVSLSGPMNFETLVPMVQDGEITNASLITSIYQALAGEEEEADLLAARCSATLQVVPGHQHAFAYWKQVGETVASFIAAE
jgi:acetyl esterase/lipase